MKNALKEFMLRGLLCMGFGPIVYGVIVLIIHLTSNNIMYSGIEIFKSIISLSLMVFLIAGSSVIWKLEKLGIAAQIVMHGVILYLAYLITYLFNNWLPKDENAILIFTIVFILGYLLIWLCIYLIEKFKTKKLNQKLTKNIKRQD